MEKERSPSCLGPCCLLVDLALVKGKLILIWQIMRMRELHRDSLTWKCNMVPWKPLQTGNHDVHLLQ